MAFFRFFVKQPVFVNLLFLLAIVAGVLTYFEMPVELNSDVSFETAAVITRYQGASPEEVEDLVAIPIEDEIKDLDGVNRVVSISAKSRSTLIVEFESVVKDLEGAVRDLRDTVDEVDDLPEEAEPPLVLEFGTSNMYPVVTAVLSRTGIIIGDYMVERGTHLGEVMVDLVEEKERDRMSDDIIAQLRSQVEKISGITAVEFAKVETGPPVGKPVAVQVRGEDFTSLE